LLGSATTRVVYDVLRFRPQQNGTPAQPVFSATLARELHVKNEPDKDYNRQDHIQCKLSYSDGFGREIQQKIRTANGPMRPADATVGSPRWIGSGWIIFNNKGAAVRQYEPFFASSHQFEFRRLEGVSPILFYDPVGRVVATLRPDHSWEKVVFDPWKTTAWDANDTVMIDPLTDPDVSEFFKRLPASEWPLIDGASPTWYKIRTTPSELQKFWPGNDDKAVWRRAQERASADKVVAHAATPARKYFDVLAREFLVITHNKFQHPRSGANVAEFASTRTIFDIEGNRRSVVDALGRTVMAWSYDMRGAPIFESSMDAGRRWMVPDAASQAVRRWDERGHSFRHVYDTARRPLEHWVVKPAAQDEDATASREFCYEKLVYGEAGPNATTDNLRGRVWEHYDPAGLVTNRRYDANGNLLIWERQFNTFYKSTPDWSKAPQIESEKFVTVTEFDALSRPTAITTPDTNGGRSGSETLPRYNISGQLAAITIIAEQQRTLRSPAREPHYIVRSIDYNAKGQRRTIQFGNDAGGEGLQTTLSYDPRTLRLSSLNTVNKGDVRSYQNLDYAYDPVGNITAIRDTAQQTFYFNNQVVSPSADYSYDAIYRLLTAAGREHIGQNLSPNAWDTHRAGTFNSSCEFSRFPNPGDGKAMRNYTQQYLYDLVGNIEEMIHQAGAGSWRRRYTYDLVQGSRDKRSNRLIATTVGGEAARYSYDLHGSMIAMPHLPAMETDFRDQLSMTQRQDVKCEPDRPASKAEQTFYVYDAGGERVRKVTERKGRRISERRYLGVAETYREYDSSGDTINFERQTVHVSDGSHRFAIMESRIKGDDGTQQQVIRCQFPNHLDSACLEVEFNPAAKIISYEEFHPYGTTAYQATGWKLVPAAKRYRFTGKERDEESGLNYHSARYLATWLGRWISADPSGVKDGPNRFAYARLNPVVFSDPTGRVSWQRVAGIATAVVVGAAITAFTGGLGAGLVLAAVAGGAVGNVAGTVVEAKLEHREVTLSEVAISAAAGIVGGFVGGGAVKLAGTAPVRAAATFVAETSMGRAVSAALDAVGSSATARAAGRVVQTLDKGLEKVEALGKWTRAAVTSPRQAIAAGETSSLAPGGGLQAHENAEGHLLREHVGKTVSDLRARLLSRPGMKTASTFVDRPEAESAVLQAFDANVAKFEAWKSSGSRAYLELNVPFKGGLVLQQGAANAEVGTGARVIVKRTADGGWHVLTGYPTR
jgi:RHS repeat-associated protein